MGNFILSGFWRKRNRANKGELEIPPMPPYKKYVALLTQTGTNAPVATVLENTIGDIVWSYETVGIYLATLNNAFPYNKVIILLGSVTGEGVPIRFAGDIWDSPNQIYIDSIKNDNYSNDVYYNTPIEIRVYN